MSRTKMMTLWSGLAVIAMGSVAQAQGSSLPPLPEREVHTTQKINLSAVKPNLRASQAIGMGIHNPQGDSVGSVNDVVFDVNTGRMRYLAVTYGGFLGIGDKLFAVPFEAFQCKVDPNNPDKHILVLNVTQKQMEGAVGFDENHWPDFADRRFTDDLDKRYGVKRNVDGVEIKAPGLDIDVKTR